MFLSFAAVAVLFFLSDPKILKPNADYFGIESKNRRNPIDLIAIYIFRELKQLVEYISLTLVDTRSFSLDVSSSVHFGVVSIIRRKILLVDVLF